MKETNLRIKAQRSVKEIEEGKIYNAVGVWEDSSGEKFYQVNVLDNERVFLYHVSHFELLEEEDEE